MKIEVRPKDWVTVIGEQFKDGMLWHIVAFDEQENEVDILLNEDQTLDLRNSLGRKDLRSKKG